MASFIDENSDDIQQEYIRYRDDLLTDRDMFYIIGWFIYKSRKTFDKLIDIGFKKYNAEFYECVEKYWVKKIKSMKKLEEKKHLPDDDIIPNMEGALKAGYYMFLRGIYNKYLTKKITLENGEIAALYLFIRETTYSSMFRFNKAGEFNVPYGGISYNSKDFGLKIMQLKEKAMVLKLKATEISCDDFESFMEKQTVNQNDFLFIDPPYDSEFSEYDQLRFEHNDQERLADYLINRCPGKFMVVIKYTPYITSLYENGTMCKNGNPLNIILFDKKYSVSFMNRNDKDVNHMLIKNY